MARRTDCNDVMDEAFAGLYGGTLVRIDCPVLNGEATPFLVVRAADGTTYAVPVMRDPEGNGPGWLGAPMEMDASLERAFARRRR